MCLPAPQFLPPEKKLRCPTRNSKQLCFSPALKTAERKGCLLLLRCSYGQRESCEHFCAGSTGINSTNARDLLVPRSISRFLRGSFPSHAPGAPGICRRAGERNFSGVCCWRLGSRNRWESLSVYARRRGGLRGRDLGPGSSPGRPEDTLGVRLENNRR